MVEWQVGDLVVLQGHVCCDVDIDAPTTCEIVGAYSDTVFEVKIPGVRETQIIPAPCLRWLADEAAGRN